MNLVHDFLKVRPALRPPLTERTFWNDAHHHAVCSSARFTKRRRMVVEPGCVAAITAHY